MGNQVCLNLPYHPTPRSGRGHNPGLLWAVMCALLYKEMLWPRAVTRSPEWHRREVRGKEGETAMAVGRVFPLRFASVRR